jgi:hypothetical protein
MADRIRLPTAEIEARCVAVLATCLRLEHVQHAKIGPYNGLMSWTWELKDAGPDAPEEALIDAMPKINKLQGEIDLEGGRYLRLAPSSRTATAGV